MLQSFVHATALRLHKFSFLGRTARLLIRQGRESVLSRETCVLVRPVCFRRAFHYRRDQNGRTLHRNAPQAPRKEVEPAPAPSRRRNGARPFTAGSARLGATGSSAVAIRRPPGIGPGTENGASSISIFR